MKENHAILAGIVVMIAMIAGIMYGVKAGNAAISVVAFLACASLLFLIKRSVEVVIEDEWTTLVAQKAATLTLNTTALLFTIVALLLISISSPDQNYDQAAYALAAVLVTISIVQVITTFWYSRTLRGTGP